VKYYYNEKTLVHVNQTCDNGSYEDDPIIIVLPMNVTMDPVCGVEDDTCQSQITIVNDALGRGGYL
jgi:hypothetical protein